LDNFVTARDDHGSASRAALASLDWNETCGRAVMDFVFMLTRNDATVENALDLAEAVRPLGLRHIGFKDVGAEPAALFRLTEAIRAGGAEVWMEVVAVGRDAQLRAFTLARDLRVDWLMGGVWPADALRILQGGPTRFLPFAGRPEGHPTRLGGQAAEVEAQCRDLAAMGCAGVDILAYRATEAEPLALVAACRRGLPTGTRVVVAGSIDCAERIAAVRAAGADAFTVGTALIDGAYAPGRGPLEAQLRAVMRDCLPVN
jgi:hypothetical protein